MTVGSLVRLGLIGGVPTVAGAWLGGFIYSPVWALLCLAVGVGAIAQVWSCRFSDRCPGVSRWAVT